MEIFSGENKYKTPHLIVNNFLIKAQIPLKMYV